MPTVGPLQKAGWAVAWARLTGVKNLTWALAQTSTAIPDREKLRAAKKAANAVVAALEEAEALLDSVRRP